MTQPSIVSTDNAPKAIGPYSQALVDRRAHLHRRPDRPRSRLDGGVKGGIREQTAQVLANLQAVLGRGRVQPLEGGQDHRVPGGHDRLPFDERGLPAGVRRSQAGPLDRRRRGPAARRAGGDRRRRDPLAGGGEWIGPGGPAGPQNRDGDAFGGSGGFDSHALPPPLPRPPGSPSRTSRTLTREPNVHSASRQPCRGPWASRPAAGCGARSLRPALAGSACGRHHGPR